LGLIVQKSASIVFCKSKPESPGPGDIALEKQKKSQPRAKAEICHRKMQPWSHFNCVHPYPNFSHLFLLLSFHFSYFE